MIEAVFILCALMSVFCVFLLSRGYFKTRTPLLLWSSFSFGFLALNNLFICVDMLIFPNADLSGPLLRNILSAIAGSLLLIGMILELT